MKIVLRFSFYLIVLLAFVSCGNPFGQGPSAVDSEYGAPANPTIAPLTPLGFEYVTGSKLSINTTAARVSDVTVGTVTKPARLVTSRSRIVYLNVQGQITTQ
jgi:hypothetical protein